jgi:protocatechuate 3,4-dioxygenase beta subunit
LYQKKGLFEMKKEQLITNRREFLYRASLTAIAIPFLSGFAGCVRAGDVRAASELDLIKVNAITDSDCSWCGAKDAPANVSWQTELAEKNDEGEPLIISGTVFQADGKRAAPNILIYVYHTDKYGIYGRQGEHRHGRFRGWMLTDEKGRYEFRTIKPASYPNTTIAAHIHFTVTSKTLKEDWIDSILFEGDKFISQRERDTAGKKGGFNPILKLEKDKDGVWRGVRDIRLDKV